MFESKRKNETAITATFSYDVICHAARWKKPNPADPTTQLGTAVLDYFGYRHERLWVWVAFAVAIGWIVLLNLLLLLAFSYLPRKGA